MMATIGVDGRSIPAPAYIAGIRRAKANLNMRFASSLRGALVPASGAEIMMQYRADLMDRINARGGCVPPKGRVSLITWGKARTPRLVLERHDIRTMNRRAKRAFADRQREER